VQLFQQLDRSEYKDPAPKGVTKSASDPDFRQRDTAYQLGFRAGRRIVEWTEIGHYSCNVAVLAGALLKRQVSRCSEA
jgi:hypothetical protein